MIIQLLGVDYTDKGFAAKAVAIHLVYFDQEYKLRIHYFISDSNDDIFNPAKKFGEALEKLVKWHKSSEFNKEKNDSEALHQFEQFYQLGTYPGLGILLKDCQLEVIVRKNLREKFDLKIGSIINLEVMLVNFLR